MRDGVLHIFRIRFVRCGWAINIIFTSTNTKHYLSDVQSCLLLSYRDFKPYKLSLTSAQAFYSHRLLDMHAFYFRGWKRTRSVRAKKVEKKIYEIEKLTQHFSHRTRKKGKLWKRSTILFLSFRRSKVRKCITIPTIKRKAKRKSTRQSQ